MVRCDAQGGQTAVRSSGPVTRSGQSGWTSRQHTPKCFVPGFSGVWYRLDFINISCDSAYPSDSSSGLDTSSDLMVISSRSVYIKKTLCYLYNQYFVRHVYHRYSRLIVLLLIIIFTFKSFLILFHLIHKSEHKALMFFSQHKLVSFHSGKLLHLIPVLFFLRLEDCFNLTFFFFLNTWSFDFAVCIFTHSLNSDTFTSLKCDIRLFMNHLS